jgi:hypothetical protein
MMTIHCDKHQAPSNGLLKRVFHADGTKQLSVAGMAEVPT